MINLVGSLLMGFSLALEESNCSAVSLAVYMVEHSTVLPVLPRGVHQSVLSVLKGKPCYSDVTSLISDYWWMFYCRANNLAEHVQFVHPLSARFAVNGQSFFCVDRLGQKHIEIPLSSV